MLARFYLVVGALLLAACATVTPYQKATDGYGYFDRQIDETHLRVAFRGNALTARETVETYLLYRAAEIAQARGYTHFKVLDQGTECYRDYTVSNDRDCARNAASGTYFQSTSDALSCGRPTSVRESREFETVAFISLMDAPSNRDAPDIFDAGAVLDNLAPVIERAPA